jgi:hypothetical protein
VFGVHADPRDLRVQKVDDLHAGRVVHLADDSGQNPRELLVVGLVDPAAMQQARLVPDLFDFANGLFVFVVVVVFMAADFIVVIVVGPTSVAASFVVIILRPGVIAAIVVRVGGRGLGDRVGVRGGVDGPERFVTGGVSVALGEPQEPPLLVGGRDAEHVPDTVLRAQWRASCSLAVAKS